MSNQNEAKIIQKDNIHTIFSDGLKVGMRKSQVFLQFLSNTPAGLHEEGRFVIAKSDVKIMLDTIASLIDYYPVKKTKKQITEIK